MQICDVEQEVSTKMHLVFL